MPYKDKKVNAECKRKWQLSNKEELKKYQHEWYIANKERIAAEAKTRHLKDPEKRKTSAKESYLKHRETRLAQSKKASRTVQGRFTQAKSQAKRRGIDFELGFEQFKLAVVDHPCEYCNLEFNTTGTGLDRIDSNFGYALGNIVPCCSDCNSAKNDMSTAEFKALVERVYENFKRKAG